MSGRDEETQAIKAAATRYVKYGDRLELESFSIAALKKAHYQLSDRDQGSGYRKVIEDLIHELEQKGLSANQADVIDVKPNFFGLGINFNEMWRRVKKWRVIK